jgi:hypothetical protein
MTANDMIDHLRKLTAEMRAKDPLLQRGIEQDWVCVVHPEVYEWLKEQFKPYANDAAILPEQPRLPEMMGRRVYVEPEASRENVEFMPYLTYLAKYGLAILRRAKQFAEALSTDDEENNG